MEVLLIILWVLEQNKVFFSFVQVSYLYLSNIIKVFELLLFNSSLRTSAFEAIGLSFYLLLNIIIPTFFVEMFAVSDFEEIVKSITYSLFEVTLINGSCNYKCMTNDWICHLGSFLVLTNFLITIDIP